MSLSHASRAFVLPVLLLAGLLSAACPGGGDDVDANPTGVGVDADRDGFTDSADNCPGDANTSQLDSDADGLGNECDNCPFAANPAQADVDADGTGDACEGGDRDADDVADGLDNCPFNANPTQSDRDGDGTGDACDTDQDNDGTPNASDGDRDGDGVGNTQDPQPDDGFRCGDSDADSCDDCASGAFNPAADGPDGNGDGVCDAGVDHARITVNLAASRRVFAVQARVGFTGSSLDIGNSGVKGAGPYDPTSYISNPPSLSVTANTLLAGEVTAGATFTQLSPDPSFLPPAPVFTLEFEYAGSAPTLGSFSVLSCEAVDFDAVVIAGATCSLSNLTLLP